MGMKNLFFTKGYILTFDSLIALFLAFFMLVLIAGQLFEPHIPRSLYLRQISQDVLAVLEKNDKLTAFVNGVNTSDVRDVLRLTGDSICIRLELLDQIGVNKSIIKEECVGTSEEIQVSFRFYTQGNNDYMLKSYAWYRR